MPRLTNIYAEQLAEILFDRFMAVATGEMQIPTGLEYKFSNKDKEYYVRRAKEYIQREQALAEARKKNDLSAVNIHYYKLRCIKEDFLSLAEKIKTGHSICDARSNIRITKTR